MLIQKIFHVHSPLSETKGRLSRMHAYRPQLAGVRKAVVTSDGVGQFDCELSHGLRAHCVLVELPTGEPNQILFRSTTGNVNLAGVVEFVPIRENLTEVQLTIEYGFRSPIHNLLNRLFKCVDSFLHRQLATLQSFLEGPFSLPAHVRPVTAHLPQLAR